MRRKMAAVVGLMTLLFAAWSFVSWESGRKADRQREAQFFEPDSLPPNSTVLLIFLDQEGDFLCAGDYGDQLPKENLDLRRKVEERLGEGSLKVGPFLGGGKKIAAKTPILFELRGATLITRPLMRPIPLTKQELERIIAMKEGSMRAGHSP